MRRVDAVIFDLGGVLVDWNPRYVFHEKYFDTPEKLEFFLDKVCTPEWNENQDAGYPIAKATEEKVAEFPDWEKAIRDYYGHWTKMLKGEMAGTVAIFRHLKKKEELKLYALTNWSAETFPIALQRFDFLQEFDGRIVSGEEKTRKPFPAIYRLLLERYGLPAGNSVFIDDSLRNVKAAEELGIRGIHFQSPDQLKESLIDLALY